MAKDVGAGMGFAEAGVPKSTPTKPTKDGLYSWQEAVDHIGETATVTGPVVNAVEGRGDITLGIGKELMEQGAFLIRISVDRAKLPLKGDLLKSSWKK